jgi:hypothetical protein
LINLLGDTTKSTPIEKKSICEKLWTKLLSRLRKVFLSESQQAISEKNLDYPSKGIATDISELYELPHSPDTVRSELPSVIAELNSKV